MEQPTPVVTLSTLMQRILGREVTPEEFDETGRKDAQFFMKVCGKQSKVLDFGCGVGRVLKHLPLSAEGYDIDPDMRGHAKTWCNRAILDSLEDKNGVYDCVIACLVIQHVPRESLLEVERLIHHVLKNRGKLVVVDTDPKISQLEFNCLSDKFKITGQYRRGNEIVRVYRKVKPDGSGNG